MNRATKEIIEELDAAIESITDVHVKEIQKKLLNLIESLFAENEELRAENQRLRDENNRLKGEQGKPDIRKQSTGSQNFSSEAERKKNKNKAKRDRKLKKKRIKIDRVEFCPIDKSLLPDDAISKGFHDVIVQDIIIKTDNIKFRKAVFYSPSLKKTFIAKLPDGYQGEFGPHIKTSILSLYHKSKMTEAAIIEFLKEHGSFIGAATVSRFLTEGHREFHQEKADIICEGLTSTHYQQMDDTSARVRGQNHYTHILCNAFYTAYFTRPQKDRLTIIDLLTQGKMLFKLNDTAFLLMETMKLPSSVLQSLQKLRVEHAMNRNEIKAFLDTVFPDPKRHQTNRQIILEATAIAAYRALPHAVQTLLTDDASQYNLIAERHSLCWIHDGRHYKKLNPVFSEHIEKVNMFRSSYWNYYDELLLYKNAPTRVEAKRLTQEFDDLFSTKTGYYQLDDRIKKTQKKKEQLLLVLKYPDIPLHNNASELGAREQARRRDINLHTMSENGTKSKDTFMTLTQTAKKLTVNFYHYIYDRIVKKYEMPSLASLIAERSQNLVFG